jgi:hypothetical protein
VDELDFADLLAQLVREEFGYVLPEEPEQPPLHARADLGVGTLTQPVAPAKLAD